MCRHRVGGHWPEALECMGQKLSRYSFKYEFDLIQEKERFGTSQYLIVPLASSTLYILLHKCEKRKTITSTLQA
jgi:hypothetical protein